jgi:hypothetical protein
LPYFLGDWAGQDQKGIPARDKCRRQGDFGQLGIVVAIGTKGRVRLGIGRVFTADEFGLVPSAICSSTGCGQCSARGASSGFIRSFDRKAMVRIQPRQCEWSIRLL